VHTTTFHRLIAGLLVGALLVAGGDALAGPKRCAAARGKGDRVEQRACKQQEPDDAADKDDATSDAAGKDDKPAEKVRRVRGGPHLDVHARDLRLTDTDRGKLERIAERYHKATKKRLYITGGTRTPERQAQLMYEKLAHGDDIVHLYENQHAAAEVLASYKDAKAKGQRKRELVKTLKATIAAQIARGEYVSKHLKSGAVDVRSRDMTPDREKAFRAAVAAEPGVHLVDERKSAEPHLHLSL
jgi:hypothetical protein